MLSHPYASAPIKAIKDHAVMLGFELVDDQDVALTTMDTKSQIMALQKLSGCFVAWQYHDVCVGYSQRCFCLGWC